MTRFGTLHPDGSMSDERDIPQSKLLECPHSIMVAEHYRADNTCLCDDPSATVMRSWGYRWSKKLGRWD